MIALIQHAQQNPAALKDAAVQFVQQNPQVLEKLPGLLKGVLGGSAAEKETGRGDRRGPFSWEGSGGYGAGRSV